MFSKSDCNSENKILISIVQDYYETSDNLVVIDYFDSNNNLSRIIVQRLISNYVVIEMKS